MSERVAIVGAREHPDLDMVREYVRQLAPSTVVVSGGAEGVDVTARQAAVAHGLVVYEYEPQDADVVIDVYGPEVARREACFDGETRALHVGIRDRPLYRNTLIALDCDRLVCFPDGSKGGCWDAVRQAKRFRRPVEIRWVDGRVVSK